MNKISVIKFGIIASTIMLLASCSLSKDHVHTIEPVKTKAATCVEEGCVEHFRCSECGSTFSDEDGNEPIEDVSIALKSHTLEKVEARPATLEAEGSEAHWECSECGMVFSEENGENATTRDTLTIPKGFARLYSGTVTESLGNEGGPFINATTTPVTVDGFCMALTETTYERWYEVYTWATSEDRGVNRYTFVNKGCEGNDGIAGDAPTDAGKEPVTEISWRDAVIWCNAASEKEGRTPVYYEEGTVEFTSENVLRVSQTHSEAAADSGKAEKAVINKDADGYRLPTEAEWEYAARGGDPSAPEWKYTYAGTDSDLDDYAVYASNSGSKSAAVATKKPNSAGLYDMSGNVWEWCQDIWSGASYRVLRSAGWYSYFSFTAVAYRYNNFYPYNQHANVGFRVVYSVFD